MSQCGHIDCDGLSACIHPTYRAGLHIVHCPHGLDLRIYPVCYLCNPRQERKVPEAVAAERARIRERVEGLPEFTIDGHWQGPLVKRAAVLAAIDGVPATTITDLPDIGTGYPEGADHD